MRPPSIVVHLSVLLAGVGALGCGNVSASRPASKPMADLTLDHVLVGIADLDEGIRLLTSLTGVAPARGGQHPGRGTQNALLSLGELTYLELIAPVRDSPLQGPMQLLAQLHQLTPIGWAVGTRHLESTIDRLQAAGLHVAPPQAGSRVRPDGRRLEWRTAQLEIPGDLKPFLIEWGATTAHPATDSPTGCAFESLAIFGPEAETAGLAGLATELGAGVSLQHDATPHLRLTLRCPAGLVTIPSAGRPPV
jgi:hypothetical protein